MTDEQVVAVTYRADAEFRAVNSEIIAGEGRLVYTYELDEAGRREALARADAMLGWELDKEIPAGALRDAGRLQFAQLLQAGVDALDFSQFPERMTLASNAGAYSVPMSEHVLAMVLSLAKNLPQRHAALAEGRWDKWLPARTVDGSVCVILGMGGIGTATARLMRALGARIYAVSRTGQTDEPAEFAGTLADLDYVLSEADVLVVSLPLTLTTRGLLGKRELGLMKPDAILINVARGAIIDEAALYEHLRAQPGFGAGIDTWWDEPSDGRPFRTGYPFFELANVIGSPHNSSIVPRTMLSAARVAAGNMRRYLRGEQIAGMIRRADYIPPPRGDSGDRDDRQPDGTA
jgi:phosphoglycerate dehydrogenase-like enzyme